MRLIKKPVKKVLEHKEEQVSEQVTNQVSEQVSEQVRTSARYEKSRQLFIERDPEQRKAYMEALKLQGTKGKPQYKDYKNQSVDEFVARVKMCIGKPDLTDGSKRLFGSKVKGVFYDVYANVCKTPTSGVVVGVRIVDPIYFSEYRIEGSKFDKEEGLLNFFEWTRSRQFFEGDIGDGVQNATKSDKT